MRAARVPLSATHQNRATESDQVVSGWGRRARAISKGHRNLESRSSPRNACSRLLHLFDLLSTRAFPSQIVKQVLNDPVTTQLSVRKRDTPRRARPAFDGTSSFSELIIQVTSRTHQYEWTSTPYRRQKCFGSILMAATKAPSATPSAPHILRSAQPRSRSDLRGGLASGAGGGRSSQSSGRLAGDLAGTLTSS